MLFNNSFQRSGFLQSHVTTKLFSTKMRSTSFTLPLDQDITAVNVQRDSQYPDKLQMKLNLGEQIKIDFEKDTPLSYLKEQIVQNRKGEIKNVQFYTITGSRLPLSELVNDLRQFPVLL